MARAVPPSGGPGFEVWLSAREGSLQRTAHLLTGSGHAGQELVLNTLARLYRRWDRIRDLDDVDREALRVLVDELRTAWRRPGRRGDRLVELVHDAPTPGNSSYDVNHEAAWDVICSLPTQQRTVAVLRFHDRLTVTEIADLTRGSVDTVASHLDAALEALRAALPHHPALTDTPTSAEDLFARTLSKVVETTHYPTTSTATVAARSRALARAGRRATALVVAAAAVVAVGGSAAVALDRGDASTQRPVVHLDPAGSLPDIPQGKAPQVAFLDGNAFVTADGERITAPVFGSATTAATFGTGVLVASPTTSQYPFATISLVSDGSTRRLGCGTPSFAVGSGDPAYWLTDGCRFVGPGRLFHGTTTTSTTKGVIYSPAGSTSSGVVANGTVGLRQGAGGGGPVLIRPDGSSSRIARVAAVAAVSPSGDLAVGFTTQGSGTVIELSTGAVQWRARTGTLGHFSASGRYVVTTQSVGVQTVQGVGDVVGIRDAATGHEVRSTVLPNLSIVGRPVWEGDESVLVVVEDRHQQQAIVRVGLDGTVTRATPVAPEGAGSFRLAASP